MVQVLLQEPSCRLRLPETGDIVDTALDPASRRPKFLTDRSSSSEFTGKCCAVRRGLRCSRMSNRQARCGSRSQQASSRPIGRDRIRALQPEQLVLRPQKFTPVRSLDQITGHLGAWAGTILWLTILSIQAAIILGVLEAPKVAKKVAGRAAILPWEIGEEHRTLAKMRKVTKSGTRFFEGKREKSFIAQGLQPILGGAKNRGFQESQRCHFCGFFDFLRHPRPTISTLSNLPSASLILCA